MTIDLVTIISIAIVFAIIAAYNMGKGKKNQ